MFHYEAAYGGHTKRDVAERTRILSWIGHHKSDQDRVVFLPDHGLYAVADGVGGSDRGEYAAQTACDVFAEEMPANVRAQEAIDAIGEYVYDEMNDAVRQTGSQTTFTGFAVTTDGFMVYLHAGDSRLMRLRGATQLDYLVSQQHQQRNYRHLKNALGLPTGQLTSEPEMVSRTHTEWGRERLLAGDRLVLATDGIGSREAMASGTEEWWWYDRLDLWLGNTALDAVNRLVDSSDIIDDATAIVVDVNNPFSS